MRKASKVPWLRIVSPFLLSSWLLGYCGSLPLRAAQTAAKPETPVSADADEQSALKDALQSAGDNPQILIKNLEGFLARFPQSSRRERVLRTICSYALQSNAPGALLQYGPMLLEITPDDPKLLTFLLDALARQNDQASRTRAIDYASRLLEIAQSQLDRAATSGGDNNTREEWTERIAAIYAQRAGFYRDSGELGKAIADDEKSYATYSTAGVAEQLGDAALKKGDSARALDYYLSAFIFPEKSPDLARRQEIRRKLGSLYLAQHHSEKGLGDLVLSRYDALLPQVADRIFIDQTQNTGRHDPFEFVLERMDGAPLPLAGYRGKVMVMEFWATWCGPCRVEGKLIDQVAGKFSHGFERRFPIAKCGSGSSQRTRLSQTRRLDRTRGLCPRPGSTAQC